MITQTDALDLPLFVYLEGSYAKEGPLQAQRNRPDASQVEYMSAGSGAVTHRALHPLALSDDALSLGQDRSSTSSNGKIWR
ncbi:MAG: hypothetical protein R3D34_03175 [Nitratireductor sp.]